MSKNYHKIKKCDTCESVFDAKDVKAKWCLKCKRLTKDKRMLALKKTGLQWQVECALCNNKFVALFSHLKVHSLTSAQYKQKFPNSKMVAPAMFDKRVRAKRSKTTKLWWDSASGTKRKKKLQKDNPSFKEEVRKKISEEQKRVWKSYTDKQRLNRLKNYPKKPFSSELRFKDTKNRLYRSTLEVKVAELLDTLNVPWSYEHKLTLGDRIVYPDFSVGKDPDKPSSIIEVTGSAWKEWRDSIRRKVIDYARYRSDIPLTIITYAKFLPKLIDLPTLHPNLYMTSIDEDVKETAKSLVLEDPRFNFDYTHFLPFHKGQCSKLHGHSSKISVAITGYLNEQGMLLDFKEAKEIIKHTIDLIDHKVFSPKYAIKFRKNQAFIKFKSKSGDHTIIIPKHEIVVLESDSTVEYLSQFLANMLLEKFPPNITAVSIKMYEGFGKSAISGATSVERVPVWRTFEMVSRRTKFLEAIPLMNQMLFDAGDLSRLKSNRIQDEDHLHHDSAIYEAKL